MFHCFPVPPQINSAHRMSYRLPRRTSHMVGASRTLPHKAPSSSTSVVDPQSFALNFEVHFLRFSRVTMEVVALPLTGTKRKNPSMEDKVAAMQQMGMEMQQKADHTRACLIMKYSAAARAPRIRRVKHRTPATCCTKRLIRQDRREVCPCFTTVFLDHTHGNI